MIATGLAAIALAVAAPGAGQTVSSAPLANTQLADPQAEAQARGQRASSVPRPGFATSALPTAHGVERGHEVGQ